MCIVMHSVAKFQKNRMGTLETLKTFREQKLRIFNSLEKSERRDPLGFFNICSVAKYQKK